MVVSEKRSLKNYCALKKREIDQEEIHGYIASVSTLSYC